MSKFKYTVCLVIIFSFNTVYSQTEIKGFFGIKLGDSYSVVLRTLQLNYKEVEQEDSKIIVMNALFFDFRWNATFKFKNNKLIEGTFLKAEFKPQIYPETSDNNFIYNSYTSYFNQASSRIIVKYGKPTIEKKLNYIWIDSNKNSITLSLKLETLIVGSGNYKDITNWATYLLIYRSPEANDDI